MTDPPLWRHNNMFRVPPIFWKVSSIFNFCQKEFLFGKFEVNRWRDLSFDFTVTLIYRVSRNYFGFLLNLRNKIRFCLKNVPCYFFFLLPCPHVIAPPRFNRNIVPFTPSVSRSSLALVAWNQRQLHVRKHRHLLWSTSITLICIDPEWRMNSINTTKGISLWVLLKIRGWMS